MINLSEGKPTVSIVIINFNTYEHVLKCIDSILKFTQGVSFEIILVENGTNQFNTNNCNWGNKVKLIISEQNLGFAGGNNLGIEHSKGTFILLINSDILLKDDAISKCIFFMQSHSEIGVLSPRLVYPNGNHQSVAQRFPSIYYKLLELFRIQKVLSKDKAGEILLGSFFDHKKTVEVDWVWGAFFLFPKKILEYLPGKKLDNKYFMYWEDVQWCMDVSRIGYKIVFYAESEVIHLHHGSNADKSSMMNNNGKLFMMSNYNVLERYLIGVLNKML